MNDIEKIFIQLKDKFDLQYTNTFSLEEDFTIDVPVIIGESCLGKFYLYADEDDKNPINCNLVFSVEYFKRTFFRKRLVKYITHWHPKDVDMAICDVEEFMLGTLIFCGGNKAK